MDSRISRRCLRILASLALISAAIFSVTAQDPDPNSPTPVLLSERESTRALAQPTGKVRGRSELVKSTSPAFSPEDTVDIFVTNLDLMEDEGANAFRVYALDKVGHQFRFPVVGIEEMPETGGVYRVTIFLKDEIGFWDAPAGDGDVLIYLTWRGLSSNRVKLGLGKIGGDIKEDPSARPTPFGTKGTTRTASRIEEINYTGYLWSGDRMRLLEQASFGPNRTLDSKLRRIGIRSWLNEQFAEQYPSTANPYPNQPLKPINAALDCDNNNTGLNGNPIDVPLTCFRDTYSQYQPQTWFFKEAFYGDAQLKHRVSWALSQIWVTSGNDIQQGRHMIEWHKVLSKHAFGNYRNLMKEMTLNPTMGEYLNMRESTSTSPNENYAREIKQLFTIGLFMLNQDGTLQRDAQNNPIPTYSQDTVNAFTRVLTGWRFCNPATTVCPNSVPATVNFIDPMVLNSGQNTSNLNSNLHNIEAKTLLSYTGSASTMNIAACPATCRTPTPTVTAFANIKTYADASLEQTIDNIFNHPNVGPFVGKILIQHLVASDPSPAYVARVAGVFNANRTNPNQMREVIRAILLDPEARGDVKSDPNYGKLREPVLFFTNFARTFGVRAASGTGLSDGNFTRGRTEFNNMAQIPFMAPTVFNYYPPDYGIPGTTLLGPEFAIMTTGTAIARATLINRLTFVNSPAGLAPYPMPFPVSGVDTPNGTSFDFSDLVALSTADATGGQLVDELNRRMMHGTMSPTMKTALMNAIAAYGTTAPESRVRQAIYLVATASQYQVQR